nr:MAG TPA: hypothetical protein [Caudoviricetes sp.]
MHCHIIKIYNIVFIFSFRVLFCITLNSYLK